MLIRIALIIILMLPVARAFAEEPVRAIEDPDVGESDIYYNAMIRSIDLDKKRWKPFGRSMENGPWFYDTHSIKRNGKKVKVLVTVFPHPQRTAMYKQVYSDHTKIRKIVFETEINCKTNTYRQPQIQVYGYYKELLAEHSNTRSTFSLIKPGTTTDTLRSLICGSSKTIKR